MPTYLTPGVQVEEIAAYPGSIEGVRATGRPRLTAALGRLGERRLAAATRVA
jgi:hypothetical protein